MSEVACCTSFREGGDDGRCEAGIRAQHAVLEGVSGQPEESGLVAVCLRLGLELNSRKR